MSQLKSCLGRASRRLPRALASAGLLLSAAAGSAILMGGEVKAQTKCFDFNPVTNLSDPCLDGDWTNDFESFTVTGVLPQTGSVFLKDEAVSPDQADVRIEFDAATPAGTGGTYEYNITTDDHNIHKIAFDAEDLIGSDWEAYKYIYSDAARTTLVDTLALHEDSQHDETIFYPSGFKTLWITDTWTTHATGITSLQNTYQTPGPLPILGAGTAFGLSRKLRSRIKASRAA